MIRQASFLEAGANWFEVFAEEEGDLLLAFLAALFDNELMLSIGSISVPLCSPSGFLKSETKLSGLKSQWSDC